MRALATTALAFSAAVFAACYLLEIGWLLFPAACMAVVGAILLVLRRRWLRGFGLALLGCAAGLGWFWLHAQFTTVEAARYDGETRAVHAKIVSFPLVAENYTRVEVKLDSDGLPRVKALLYDNDGVLNDAEPGEWLDLEARLRPADRRYGESYDGYISRDIYLIASAKGEIRRTPGGLSPELFPLRLNRMLTEHVQGLFPEDTAAFFRALMLGD